MDRMTVPEDMVARKVLPLGNTHILPRSGTDRRGSYSRRSVPRRWTQHLVSDVLHSRQISLPGSVKEPSRLASARPFRRTILSEAKSAPALLGWHAGSTCTVRRIALRALRQERGRGAWCGSRASRLPIGMRRGGTWSRAHRAARLALVRPVPCADGHRAPLQPLVQLLLGIRPHIRAGALSGIA